MSFFAKTLKDKKVCITGAGKGIGKALMETLSKEGCKLIAISRTKEDLDYLKKQFNCKTIQADLSDPIQCENAGKQVGNVDYLINNAGISIVDSFLEAKLDDLKKIMNTNVYAVFQLTQIIAKNMIENNIKGSIVNISSHASQYALSKHVAYTASKGALDSMTKVMALELGQHGIRVNTVNPTVTWTPLAKRVWGQDEQLANTMINRIPTGRFIELEDVVNTVIYLLCCDQVNAQSLFVDGGLSHAPFNLASKEFQELNKKSENPQKEETIKIQKKLQIIKKPIKKVVKNKNL